MFKNYIYILLFLIVLFCIYRINIKEGLLNGETPINIQETIDKIRNVNDPLHNSKVANYTNNKIEEDLGYFNNASYLIKHLNKKLPIS